MARNDDSQHGTGAPSRVYKSSDVHKRRANRKDPAKGESDSASPDALGAEPSGANAASAKDGVVITPEFGKRTQAQKEADDRWFDALRASDLSVGGVERQAGSRAPSRGSAGSASGAQGPSAPAAQGRRHVPPKPASHDASAGAGAPAGEHLPSDAPPDAKDADAAPSGEPSKAAPEGAPAGTAPAPEPSPADQAPKVPKRLSVRLPRKRGVRIVLIVVAVVLVAAIVAGGLFAWNRWYRFDDRADMQGTWYVAGTTVPVAIDEGSIHLTDDVVYRYEINDRDKTIRYVFGPMEGRGRYWFSDDRKSLVITDGDDFDGTNTAIEDLMRQLSEMGGAISGSAVELPSGDGIIAFTREPDAAALKREQDEAARKAAEGAAARRAAEEEAARIAAEEAAEAGSWEVYRYDAGAGEAPADEPSGEGTSTAQAPREETVEGR